MKTRSFIIGWALVVLLAGACSVQAEIVRSYDFNHLNTGSILGQDTPSWMLIHPAWENVSIVSIAGPAGESPSNAACRDFAVSGNNENVGDFRDWSTSVSFTSTDTAITQSFRLIFTSADDVQGIYAGARFGDLDLQWMVFGIENSGASGNVIKWLLRDGSGTRVFGDNFDSRNHWYDVKLVMDFSTDGGLGTLYYRDLTMSVTEWTQDSTLVDIPLNIPQSGGEYEVTGLTVRLGDDSSGAPAGYIDNYALDDPKIPEPSTLVLLTTGLIGLLCYAWRKRK